MNKPHTISLRRHAAGMTLVELMVAMTIGLLVTLVASTVLVYSRQGYSGLDGAAQLRDSARLAHELVQRVVGQAGFESNHEPTGQLDLLSPPHVEGANDARVQEADLTMLAGTGINGSDVLIVRYQGMSDTPGSAVSDGSIVNCVGQPEPAPVAAAAERSISVFHVGTALSGEPALRCTFRTAGGAIESRTLLEGVESLQVLYGVANVTPGVAPAAMLDSVAAAASDVLIQAPDRYLRADQLIVAGDADGTRANWRRVRSARIGLLLRGPVGSASQRVNATWRPLGVSGVPATATDDPGTVLSLGADGRLRRAVTFTVYFHNPMELPPAEGS